MIDDLNSQTIYEIKMSMDSSFLGGGKLNISNSKARNGLDN